MADPRSSSASSKLIAERLRLGALPASSAHPDPDLLTAFAERSLNEKERAQVLEHLARCTVCRDVVYLAQPEEEAASPVTAGSRAPIRWFAWRRLQWAALAASLSIVVALAVFLRENPDHSVLTGRAASQPSSPQTVAESQPKNDTTSSTYGYTASDALEKERGERKESAFASVENQGKLKAEAKLAEGAGHKSSVHGNADLKSRDFDALATLGPKVTLSSADDLNRQAKLSDKEAAAKQAWMSRGDERGPLALSTDEKDTFIAGNAVRGTNSPADQNGQLFDLQQQKVQSGPSATNFQYNAQNQAANEMYLDRNVQVVTKSGAPAAAAPAPPPVAKTDSSLPEQTAKQAPAAGDGRSAGVFMAAAKAPAPTRAVVPAEEARKKKLETIPAHVTPQGTEETVAVAGRLNRTSAEPAASSGAATGGPVLSRSGQASGSAQTSGSDSAAELTMNGRNAATMVQLTPGVAPTSAITGWRVRHGRLEERLYGNWHEVVLRKQPMSSDSSVTEVSAAFGHSVNVATEANSRAAEPVSADMLVPPRRFTSVASLGADVWLVEMVGKSQLVVHHSRDAGITWQPSTIVVQGILNPNSQAAIKFKDAQQGEIILSSGEKWQTADGGVRWNLVK